MTEKPTVPSPMPFLDNPHAPDFFADDATGFFTHGSVMRITLEAHRSSYVSDPIPVNRVVIGRLAMPVAAAEAMAKGILAQVEQLRKNPPTAPQNAPPSRLLN